MIQPQELRIGNLLDVDGNIIKVGRIDENLISWNIAKDTAKFKIWNPFLYISDKRIRPIPLTEEILLNFGFEKIKSDEYPHKFIINKYMSYEVEIENLNSQNCFVFSHGKKFSSITIEYVHQLQNLYFSLTGEELTFKK